MLVLVGMVGALDDHGLFSIAYLATTICLSTWSSIVPPSTTSITIVVSLGCSCLLKDFGIVFMRTSSRGGCGTLCFGGGGVVAL